MVNRIIWKGVVMAILVLFVCASLVPSIIGMNSLWINESSEHGNSLGISPTSESGQSGFWSITEVVSVESTGWSGYSRLFIDSEGTLHVAWRDSTNSPSPDIFYKTKPVDGNWSAVETINDASISSWSAYPSLFVDSSGTVHASWTDSMNYQGSGTKEDIFYRYKLAGGDWSEIELVSTDSINISFIPSMAVDSTGVVHVVWSEGFGSAHGNIVYKYRSTDGIWSQVEVVSFESTTFSFKPSMSIDNDGTVHVAWHDDMDYGGSGSNRNVFYKYKVPGGNWTSAEVVSSDSNASSASPSLAVDATGTVHVAWPERTSADGNPYDVYYKYKPAGGNWTAAEEVSTESECYSWYPSLAVDATGTVHVAWMDKTDYQESGNDDDIFYKYKPANGYWSTTEVVSTESTNKSGYPSLAIDATTGTVHVTWSDYSDYDGSGSDRDIFYKYKNIEVQEILLEGFCYYQNMNPVDLTSVEIYNINTGVQWNADAQENYYWLLLTSEEISAGQTLRYIARDTDGSLNVTDYVVTANDVVAGEIRLDFILDIHYRDLTDFPFYVSQVDTGAMVMKQMLDFLLWSNIADPEGPPSVYREQDLFDTYNVDGVLDEGVLTAGLVNEMRHNFPIPPEYEGRGDIYYGYFFSADAFDNALDALKWASVWIGYPVDYHNDIREIPVPQPGHTNHVPVAVPTGGDYDNWMVIRGIHADTDPWPYGQEFELYGFWINDPSAGGIGANWYMTTQYFMDTYFDAMTVGNNVDNWVVVVDPPAEMMGVETEAIMQSTCMVVGEPVQATKQQARMLRFLPEGSGIRDAILGDIATQGLQFVYPDIVNPEVAQISNNGNVIEVEFIQGHVVGLDLHTLTMVYIR